MKLKYLTTSSIQTKKLGEILAKETLKTRIKKTALIFGLEGDLGGGKTTFLQGFAKGLGIKQKILSPTFVIIKRFQIPGSRFQNFYHIDCYRVEKTKEILDLGFKKIILNPKNIVVIEWSDRIKKILPADIIILKFKFINEKTREVVFKLKDD